VYAGQAHSSAIAASASRADRGARYTRRPAEVAVPVRAIVFDLFDTLVDLRWERLPVTEHRGKRLPASTPALHERVRSRRDVALDAFVDTMVQGDRDFAETHYQHDREVPTELRMGDVLRRLGIEDAELARELTRLHMGVLRSGVELLAHHGAVLDQLRRTRRLGLCSNFSHSETALAVLEDAGLRDRLDPAALVVSDAFGLRKPRAEIFAEVVSRLGVDAADALHVGDSLRADVAGAAKAGLRTAWITRRVSDPEAALAAHEGPRPDHVIGDLAELPELVAALG
jgi:putative hydrolase of the HAD superfamily